jgi:hypothetical protein
MVLRIACGHGFQVRALSVSGYYDHCSYYGRFGKGYPAHSRLNVALGPGAAMAEKTPDPYRDLFQSLHRE